MKQQNSDNPAKNQPDISPEALAWAEFLYDQYILSKHKQLLFTDQVPKIEPNNGVTDD